MAKINKEKLQIMAETKAITKELAQEEIERWLDYKKVGEKKRETFVEAIATMTDAVASGNLILEDDYSFTYHLKFPLESDKVVSVTTLKFKPRLKVNMITPYLQGVKNSDGDGRIIAYTCALTTSAKGIIQSLDTEDHSLATSIAAFFM